MNVKFFSPNGESWKISPDLTDRSNLYTTPVRRYVYGGAHYTVLACIDYNNPHKVFYNLEVRRPEGVNFPASQERDFKILHNLMTEFPIPTSQYEKCEKKLEYKVSQLKVEEWKQERQGMTEEILRKMDRRANNCMDREADALIAEVGAERLERIAAREQRELLLRPTASVDGTNTVDQRPVDTTVALYQPHVPLPSLNDVQLIAALLNTLSCCSGEVSRLIKKEKCMYTPWATHQPMIAGSQQRNITMSNTDLLVIRYTLQAARCLYRLLRPDRDVESVSMTTNICSTYPVAYIKTCSRNGLVPFPMPYVTSNRITYQSQTSNIVTESVLDRIKMPLMKYVGNNAVMRRPTYQNIAQGIACNTQASPRNITDEDVSTDPDLRTHDSMPSYRLPTIKSYTTTDHIDTYNVADAADVVDVAADVVDDDVDDDDDDYNGLFGGILGVFARSNIHGDYSESVGHVDEKKIC